jgi:hypothetical protein
VARVPGVGQPPCGRLEPDHAAERRRHAHGPCSTYVVSTWFDQAIIEDRTNWIGKHTHTHRTEEQLTASVRAERDGAQPGADGGGGPARGPAGHPAGVVGVAAGAVVRVDAAGPRAQLVHVGLPRHHGAARAQTRHARRVRAAPPRLAKPPRASCTRAVKKNQ